MKKALLFLLFSLGTLPAFAQSPYSIDLLSGGKEYAFHEGGWKQGTDGITVKVKVDSALKKEDMIVKAYFYDDSKEPVASIARPNAVVLANGSTLSIPMEIEKGKKHEFFFAIPSNIARGSKKWRRVLVVFGSKSQVTARVYPKDEVANFSFPEKSLYKQ